MQHPRPSGFGAAGAIDNATTPPAAGVDDGLVPEVSSGAWEVPGCNSSGMDLARSGKPAWSAGVTAAVGETWGTNTGGKDIDASEARLGEAMVDFTARCSWNELQTSPLGPAGA